MLFFVVLIFGVFMSSMCVKLLLCEVLGTLMLLITVYHTNTVTNTEPMEAVLLIVL